MLITQLERQYNGAYVFTASAESKFVWLTGLFPVIRDLYEVKGADYKAGNKYFVDLVDEEIREVFIFYYFA